MVGLLAVRAVPGQGVDLAVPVHPRDLAHDDGSWSTEPGDQTLCVDGSVADLPATVALEVSGPG